jgi:hypothetical protein
MPKIVLALLFALLGYVACALVGYVLVSNFSTNRHDKAVEAAMTAVFVCGPLGAIVGGIFAFLRNS